MRNLAYTNFMRKETARAVSRVEALIEAGVATSDACATVGMATNTLYYYRWKIKNLVAQARENAGPASATVATDHTEDTPR